MKKGRGINETFTVRRIVNNEGVERIFPLHSPYISKVTVKRSGETRRAKLFYLRDRVGKATRLVEVRKIKKEEVPVAPTETPRAGRHGHLTAPAISRRPGRRPRPGRLLRRSSCAGPEVDDTASRTRIGQSLPLTESQTTDRSSAVRSGDRSGSRGRPCVYPLETHHARHICR